MEHAKVLNWLEKTYGNRKVVAALLDTTESAIYFWSYRNSIPEQFHGKLIAIGVPPGLLIEDHDSLVKRSIALRSK